MDFKDILTKRYSVRKFQDVPVKNSDAGSILEAGRNAPTAGNKQPQRIIVVSKKEGLSKIDACTPCRFGAPLVLIVCYDKTASWVRKFDGENSGLVDASIAACQMMFRAWELGVGSTWVMHFDPQILRKNFNLSESLIPAALLVMGYTAPDASPADMHWLRNPIEKIASFEE
ncbi:MAG: nitroreductase family protein [Spirochaetaceae bacterium]|jgi:nitroreductase|nr:nitroreductase family protein [Spirochaetaceae bacterium]